MVQPLFLPLFLAIKKSLKPKFEKGRFHSFSDCALHGLGLAAQIHPFKHQIITIMNKGLLAILSVLVCTALLQAQNPNGDLRIEMFDYFNIVVDNNVQTPAGASPRSVYIGVKICNDGGNDMSDVFAFIGDYNNSTPGIYPQATYSSGPFTGTFSFTHEGGTADATRYIGDLGGGDCITQYWLLSYPLVDANNNNVTGNFSNQNDDLLLTYDVWATGVDNGNFREAEDSKTVHLRAMLSASSNKIWPNTTSKVPHEYLDAFPDKDLGWRMTTDVTHPGATVVLEGIWFNCGNVNKGFDNDGDYQYDYNFMLQPVGNPAVFDPNCFRLVKVSGLIVVKPKNSSNYSFEFEDQLHFQDLPKNTGAVGMVFYEFAVLNGPCSSDMTPYQAAAKGKNREKFNGDFGITGGTLTSLAPTSDLEVSAPATASSGDQIEVSLQADNTSSMDLGMPEYGAALVIEAEIPSGATYVSGSAQSNNSYPSGMGASILYSTDNGTTWLTNEPFPASSVNLIQWWLTEPLESGDDATVTFDVDVSPSYSSSTITFEGGLSTGNRDPFATGSATVNIVGGNTVSGTVFLDDGGLGGTIGNGVQDGPEDGIPGVTVELYNDLNSNGLYDNNDVLVSQFTSQSNGSFSFPALSEGNYIVKVDETDGNLPVGTISTTPIEYAVVISGGDVQVNFGFASILEVTNTLTSNSIVSESDYVNYQVQLQNLSYTTDTDNSSTVIAWASVLDPATNFNYYPNNLLGPPDVQLSWPSNWSKTAKVKGFDFGVQPGVIEKVEIIISICLDYDIYNDYLTISFQKENGGTAYVPDPVLSKNSTPSLNDYVGPPNIGWLILDVTDIQDWDWSIFDANWAITMDGIVVNSDDGSKQYTDAIGVRVTTTCCASDSGEPGNCQSTLTELPLEYEYDETKLEFVSSDPAADAVSNGVVTFNQLGPLYPNETKLVDLQFRALNPPVIDNNCTLPEPVPYCSPPSSGYYSDVTINGNVTWNSILSNVDPTNMYRKVRISGTGTVTVPSGDLILPSSSSLLVTDGVDLVVANGSLVLENWACAIFTDGVLRTSGNIEQQDNSYLCIYSCEVECGDEEANGYFSGGPTSANFTNDGGTRHLENVCLNVTQNYTLQSTSGGNDVLINVCAEIGDQGPTDATTGTIDGSDSGSFSVSRSIKIFNSRITVIENVTAQSGSTMDVCATNFRTLNGNFQSSGTLGGYDLTLWVDDGSTIEKNGGSWNAAIEARRGNTSGSIPDLPANLSVANIAPHFDNCACSGDITAGDPTSTTTVAIVTGATNCDGLPISDSDESDGVTFINLGSISGYVFGDADNDGWQGIYGYENGTDNFIPGVEVNLYGCFDDDENLLYEDVYDHKRCTHSNNDGHWELVKSDTTDADGIYRMTGIRNGYYYLEIDETTLTNAADQTADPDVTNGLAGQWADKRWKDPDDDLHDMGIIGIGNDHTQINFGYNILTTISGIVWNDINGDGVKDPSEPTIPNVPVEFSHSGCTTGSNCAVRYTNGQGIYELTTAVAGVNYNLSIDLTSVQGADSWTITYESDGTPDNSNAITVSQGQQVFNIDFGLQASGPLSLGGTVYYDWTGNAHKDTGDEGMPGVTMKLYKDNNHNGSVQPSDQLVQTVVTDINGAYLFANKPSDSYVVTVDESSVPIFPKQTEDPDEYGPCTVCDAKTAVTVTSSEFQVSVVDVWNYYNAYNSGCEICDEGYTSSSDPPYISNDLDVINFQDPINNPAACVTELAVTFNIAASDWERSYYTSYVDNVEYYYPIELNGVQIGTFNPTELPYWCGICESITVNFPVDLNVIPYNFGGTNTLDINFRSYNLTKPSNQRQDMCVADIQMEFLATNCSTDYQSLDFGYQPTGGTGEIVGYVFQDDNANGVQNSGEARIRDVEVRLEIDLNEDGIFNWVESTVTNSNGDLSFDELLDSDYRLVVNETDSDLPVDYTGAPAQLTTLGTQTCEIDNGEMVAVNGSPCTGGCDTEQPAFGFAMPGAATGFVFSDDNGNGTQDENERGLGNVDLYICNAADGYCNATNALNTVSSANGAGIEPMGFYIFAGLPSGNYVIAVDLPSVPTGYELTADPSTDGIPCYSPLNGSDPNFTFLTAECDNQTNSIAIALGSLYTGANFGYQPPGVIGGQICFNICDDDGDNDDDGISNECDDDDDNDGIPDLIDDDDDGDGILDDDDHDDDNDGVMDEDEANDNDGDGIADDCDDDDDNDGILDVYDDDDDGDGISDDDDDHDNDNDGIHDGCDDDDDNDGIPDDEDDDDDGDGIPDDDDDDDDNDGTPDDEDDDEEDNDDDGISNDCDDDDDNDGDDDDYDDDDDDNDYDNDGIDNDCDDDDDNDGILDIDDDDDDNDGILDDDDDDDDNDGISDDYEATDSDDDGISDDCDDDDDNDGIKDENDDDDDGDGILDVDDPDYDDDNDHDGDGIENECDDDDDNDGIPDLIDDDDDNDGILDDDDDDDDNDGILDQYEADDYDNDGIADDCDDDDDNDGILDDDDDTQTYSEGCDKEGLEDIKVVLTNLTPVAVSWVFYNPGQFVLETYSDVDGNYVFTSLPDGTYQVAVEVPVDYSLKYEVDGVLDSVTQVVIYGGDVTNNGNTWCSRSDCSLAVDFCMSPSFKNTLAGVVCLDGDEDGRCDTGGETFPEGTEVSIFDLSGTSFGETVTAADGTFFFDNLPTADMVVSVSKTVAPLRLTSLTTSLGDTPAYDIVDSDNNAIQYVSVSGDITGMHNGFTFSDTFDLGDLPAPFLTRADGASPGPAHIIPAVPTLYLGTGIDAEVDPVITADAVGDDSSGSDDEDGVTFTDAGTWTTGADGGGVSVVVNGNGYLVGFADFNDDGDFDDSGEMFLNETVTPGTYNYNFDIPNGTDLSGGQDFYFRFRLFESAPFSPSTSYNGIADNGEVEDYMVSVCKNLADAGTISGTETGCDGYDPSIIAEASAASGGGGSIEYLWEESVDGGLTWSVIPSATGATFDPGAILLTTRYRRGARRFRCSAYVYSNVVTKTVVTNYTNGGLIVGDEDNCGIFDPDLILNVIAPSGGVGTSSPFYQWEQSTDNGNNWTAILNANEEFYNPGVISQTTLYRRGAQKTPCGVMLYSNVITKMVSVNYTDAGAIAGDESVCGTFDPTLIASLSLASGGVDGFEMMQWQESTNNGASWSDISGATSATYDPGLISQTTWYRRKSRRVPCAVWVNSNVVTKTVRPFPIANIITYPISPTGFLCELTGYDFEAEDAGVGVSYTWDFGTYSTPSSALGQGLHQVEFDVPDNVALSSTIVTLTTSEDGCVSNDNRVLTFRPEIIIDSIATQNPTACQTNDGIIWIYATYPSGTTIEYSVNGGITWDISNQASNLAAGVYDIRARYQGGDCVATYGIVALSDPPPQADLLVSSSEECTGQTVVIEAVPTNGNPVFTWAFGNGAIPNTASGAGPHSVYFTNGGYASIAVTMVENNCVGVRDTSISIVENYTDGGTILGGETLCSTFDPANIVAGANPSGGTGGTLVYQWEYREDDGAGGFTAWADVAGANAASYDPGIIAATTEFRRKARRAPCSNWAVSNTVLALLVQKPNLVDDNYSTVCPGFAYADNVSDNDLNLVNPTYSLLVFPTNGTLDFEVDGEFIYDPNSTYCGTDEFQYLVCNDGTGCCDTALVVIDLTDNNPPTILNVPNNLTISCDDQVPVADAVDVVEDCQTVSIGTDEISTQGVDSCALNNFQITRIWKGVDYCSNTATSQQVIVIEDKTAPDIYRIYTLPNGQRMVAGVMENVSNHWKTISLPIQFGQQPVIFTQLVTRNDATPAVPRLRNVSTTQFQLKLQEEEGNDGVHAKESVAWVAFEKGTYSGTNPFEVNTWLLTSSPTNNTFANSYASAPDFFLSIQSNNEIDPANPRVENLTDIGVDAWISEETSSDAEITHNIETVGYLAMLGTGNITNNAGEVIGELGRVDLTSASFHIDLVNKYHNPVVVMGAIGNNEIDPVTARVTTVTSTGFDAFLDEWDYLDGIHGIENLSYLVIEGSLPLDRTVACDGIPEPLNIGTQIIAVDNCDATIQLLMTADDFSFDCQTDTTFSRTWTTVDDCGNLTTLTETYILIDTVPPTFTVPANLTIVCTDDKDDLVLTGDVLDEMDNCSEVVSVGYSDDLANLAGCNGHIVRTWTAADNCGNQTVKTQFIYVSPEEDTDGDGRVDYFDLDDDNDGIPDLVETDADDDGDGIPNDKDLDSDNDGIPDIIEIGGTDVNGDGVADNVGGLNWDNDNDGFAFGFDGNDIDPSVVASVVMDPGSLENDRDGDGAPNFLDRDSDNDGIPDLVETGGVDVNGDGMIDFPVLTDPLTMQDNDNDGFADIYDPDSDNLSGIESPGNPLIVYDGSNYSGGQNTDRPDTDGDMVPDFLDSDSDNDGTGDLIEAGGIDINGDGRLELTASFVDLNNDGYSDIYVSFPLVLTDGDGAVTDGRPEDTDGDGSAFERGDIDNDGSPNHHDLDCDGDNILDILETGLSANDGDGDGVWDNWMDSNLNGYDDVAEALANIMTEGDGATTDGRAEDSGDADETPYLGAQPDGTFAEANGNPDIDDDADGLLNFLDTDSDNDFLPDGIEDQNYNDIQDEGETGIYNPDSDFDNILDGIEDRDQDGLFEPGETDPLNPNTDGDGLQDGEEDLNGNGILDPIESDPTDACDPVLNEACRGVVLDIKVKLVGALVDQDSIGLMRDDLRFRQKIPYEEPYTAIAHLAHIGEDNVPAYNGPGVAGLFRESFNPGMMYVTGIDAPVDWILVELRAASNPDSIVATKAGLLQRDGDVRDIDGLAYVTFDYVSSGNYYVAVRHRNHLGIMSESPYLLSPEVTQIDFTKAETGVFGENARCNLGGIMSLWGGDLNGDANIIYQGQLNDILTLFISIVLDENNTELLANYIVSSYDVADFNLDGDVIFQGPNNDKAKLLIYSVLASPGNLLQLANYVLMEKLP